MISPGGNLTLALLVALRDADKPLPAGAVALSPATDLAFTGASIKTRAHLDPILANIGSDRLIPDYITTNDPHHPYISPLYADLRGLPPLLIHVGDLETLLDDAVRFGERARAAGVGPGGRLAGDVPRVPDLCAATARSDARQWLKSLPS